MKKPTLSAQELFLKLGSTPRTRSVRAEQLFRKLRDGEPIDVEALMANSVQRQPQKRRKQRPVKIAAE